MFRLIAIALLLASPAPGGAAAPRIAVVRVTEIYAELPATVELKQRIKAERDAIMKDERAEQLRRMISELLSLQARLSDKANPLDDETARKLARTYEIKRQEAQTLQREFGNFHGEQEKAINRKMVADMRESLKLIADTSRRVAKEQGYDLTFDGSGNTNTGMPFIIYQKAAPDLTATVKAALMDGAAKSVSSTPSPP